MPPFGSVYADVTNCTVLSASGSVSTMSAVASAAQSANATAQIASSVAQSASLGNIANSNNIETPNTLLNFNINTQGTPTNSSYYPHIFQTNDAVSASETVTGAVGGIQIVHNLNNGFSGARDIVNIGMNINATNALPNQDDHYRVLYSYNTANVPSGGSILSNDGTGYLYGTYSEFVLNNGATFWGRACAVTARVTVYSGASVGTREAVSAQMETTNGLQGYIDDAAIAVNNPGSGGAQGAWQYGLKFGAAYNFWPFNTYSTLIGAPQKLYGFLNPTSHGNQPQGYGYNKANYGLDFRDISFSTAAIATYGYQVDSIGNLAANSLTTFSNVSAAFSTLVSANLTPQNPNTSGGLFISWPYFSLVGECVTPATLTTLTMVASGGSLAVEANWNGYINGDVVTLQGCTGTAPTYTVEINNGVLTLSLLTPGSVTAIPQMGILPWNIYQSTFAPYYASFSGGSGSNLNAIVGFTISSLSTTPGSGYPAGTVPFVELATAPINTFPTITLVMSSPIASTLFLNNVSGSQADTVITGSTLSTSASAGFLVIPTMAGAPTGTPVNTGASIVLNSNSGALNLYYNGSWHHTTLSSGAG